MSKLSDADLERIATRVAEKLSPKPQPLNVNVYPPISRARNMADLLAQLQHIPPWSKQ